MPENRMIHAESQQLFIGPNAQWNVRAIPGSKDGDGELSHGKIRPGPAATASGLNLKRRG
jgi:hypothetical protein